MRPTTGIVVTRIALFKKLLAVAKEFNISGLKPISAVGYSVPR
ncbi:MAG: hypothetical protein R3E39_22420 [Anaerolineae bacterium]